MTIFVSTLKLCRMYTAALYLSSNKAQFLEIWDVESENESNDDDELQDTDNVHELEEDQATDVGALTKSEEEGEDDIKGAFTDSEKEKKGSTGGAFTSVDRDNEEDGYTDKENITGIDQRSTDLAFLYDLLKASGVEKPKLQFQALRQQVSKAYKAGQFGNVIWRNNREESLVEARSALGIPLSKIKSIIVD
ncbi:hypothetical protein PS15m_011738 [Mucor circinelloides]